MKHKKSSEQKTSEDVRPIIGLLLDSFFVNYESEIWQGIVDFTEENSIDLICFIGGSIKSPYSHYAQRNTIYELVHKENVDGLIAVAGSLSAWIGEQELAEFYRQFSPLPLVSIGTAVKGFHSVVVDNRTGMEELIEHLITVHKYRNIAFIYDPRGNPDAEGRFLSYQQVLARHQIPLDPGLVVAGDFVKTSVSQSLSELLEQRKTQCDAIVAANDYLAIEIIRSLKRRGYQVPRDIAVVGFDDLDESRYLSQPLTTVRQPAYELGQQALRTILSLLAGSVVPEKTVLPAKMIKRRSCGCFLGYELQVEFNEDAAAAAKSPAEIHGFQDTIIAGIIAILEESFIKFKNPIVKMDWSRKLVYTLFQDLDSLQESGFLSTLENIVTEAIIVDIEVLTWHKIIIEIFTHVKKWITRQRENIFLDSLFKRSLEMIREIAVRSLTYLKLKAEEKEEMLFTISQAFITVFDFEKLGEIVGKELPPLGIKKCFISLYKDGKTDRAHAQLIVAREESQPDFRYPAALPFKAIELIPGGIRGIKKRKALIVMALFYKDEQLGYALFDIGTSPGNVYETLAIQISSALKGIRLLDDVQEHTSLLEAKIKARTNDLHEANQRLKQEIMERQRTAEILHKKNEEIKRLNRQLEEKSRIDSLTRLYNREAFFNLLEQEIRRTHRTLWRLDDKVTGGSDQAISRKALRKNKPSGRFHEHLGTLSIMLVDIDNFKTINDTYGHLVGDNVLRALGILFKRKDIFRQEDFVGRYGGEEFLVVCPDTNARNTLELGKRLAAEFRKIGFTCNGGKTFSATLSIGISEYYKGDKDSIDVIHRADQAMYHAKQQGRDLIMVYEEIFGDKTKE